MDIKYNWNNSGLKDKFDELMDMIKNYMYLSLGPVGVYDTSNQFTEIKIDLSYEDSIQRCLELAKYYLDLDRKLTK